MASWAGLKSFLKPNFGGFKKLPMIGALAAGAVALPFIAGSLRDGRRYDEDATPAPKALSDPLPPLLDFVPNGPAIPPMGALGGNTMMGMQPVEGAMAQKIKMQRAGINAGPDVSSPNTTTPSGVSMIDGKHVQDLNKEASMPSPGLAI